MSNNMRISGLASGMDIDKMVSDLMKAERQPLDKLTQKKQILEWQRDGYRDMNKTLKELDDLLFTGVGRQGNFLTKKVTSTNEAAVTATASGLSGNTSAQISVSQLAEISTGISGTLSADPNAKIDPTKPLDQAGTFRDNSFGTSFELKVFQPDGTFKNLKFDIDPSKDSLNDIFKKINDSGLGVTAFYDSQTDKVSISTKQTGDNKNGAEIELVSETGGNFFTKTLGFTSTAIANTGKNAAFTINGLATERTTNTFTISNITYTLKQANSTATITTTTDTDSIFNTIKSFVDKYNEVIGKVNDKISEKRYRDYPPLTSEQRKEMSDKEAELWDEKAKSGMLSGDSILSTGLAQLRRDIYSSVNTGNKEMNQLAQIGIKTTSDYLANGKLEIDETKLRDAIAKDPESVMKVFANRGTTYEDKGIAYRMRDSIDATMAKVELKAGKSYSTNQQFTIGKNLIDVDKRISDLQERLKDTEDRYYRQFTAMETAIQRANQQSTYLMQQFGGGQ